jgi:hypothetical protein
VCKSLPLVLIGWVLWSVYSSPWGCLDFLLGYFKICLSWNWSNLRQSGVHLPLWWEDLPVICAFWHAHSFYPFPHSIVIHPFQFKFPYQLPLPNIHSWYSRKWIGLNSWKWTNTYFISNIFTSHFFPFHILMFSTTSFLIPVHLIIVKPQGHYLTNCLLFLRNKLGKWVFSSFLPSFKYLVYCLIIDLIFAVCSVTSERN